MYNIKEHGDPLEKDAFEFVSTYFSGYEKVWSIYVGNTGKSTMSTIPGYKNEEKRVRFAENSYSLFEATYLCHNVIESGIFNNAPKTIQEHITLTNSFHLFFVYLGKMRDLSKKITKEFSINAESFINSIEPYYDIRNIVIHGKKVPLKYDSNGIIVMPPISGNLFDNKVWHDGQTWDVFQKLDNKNLHSTLCEIFYSFLAIINNHYFKICSQIEDELKSDDKKIKFEYKVELTGDNYSIASGTTTTNIPPINNINTSGSLQ